MQRKLGMESSANSWALHDGDWERRVRKVFGKGMKYGFVPFGALARQALPCHIQTVRPKPAREGIGQVFLAADSDPLTVNAIIMVMRRLAKGSGVRGLHAHLLRHCRGVQ